MAVPVLTIAGNARTAYIHGKAFTFKLNSLDVTLVDPPTVPALGDAVTVDSPAWSGTVTARTVTDNDKTGHKWVKVTATNSDVAVSAAGGTLSDVLHEYRNLSITVSRHSGVDEVRGSLETFKSGFLPGHEIQLTAATHGYTNQQFSVREVKVSWLTDDTPLYDLDIGDPIVELSTWVEEDSGVLPITTTKITDGAVSTPKLAAGSITADKLAAQLILASLIKTADSGTRLELDAAGMRAYDSSDNLLVNIPTDGSSVYVRGDLLATSLTVTGQASFRGVTDLEMGSVTTARAGIVAPTTPPAVSAIWPSTGFAVPSLTHFELNGGYYDSAGGASGATACWVALVRDTDTNTMYVYEWKLADGTIDRITTLGSATASGDYLKRGFITRIGTSWYVCGYIYFKSAPSTFNTYLLKYTRATGAYTNTIASVGADFWFSSEYGWCIRNDGTNLYVLGPSTSANNLRVVKYNTSLAKQSTVELTEPGLTSPADTISQYAFNFEIANLGSGNAFYVSIVQYRGSPYLLVKSEIHEFNLTTGARTSNIEWPMGTGSDRLGMFYDGTNFKYAKGSPTTNLTIATYTNWTWTTETPIYQVAYAWYDSVGTTHETAVSPRKAFTMSKRARMVITMPSLPGSGGVDDPDNRRVYLLRSATDTGAGTLKLQTTTTSTQATLDTYNAAGAADGAGTAFAAGTAGKVLNAVNTNGQWEFRGDGYAVLTKLQSALQLENGSLTALGYSVITTDGGDVLVKATSTDTQAIAKLSDGGVSGGGFGALEFGAGGSTALDVRLYRNGADLLKTDDSLEVGNALTLSNHITSTVDADQNNYNPTGLSTCAVLRFNSFTATRTLTGLTATVSGHLIHIVNDTGQSLVLANASASSSAANQFRCPNSANLTVRARGSVFVQYVASKWQVVGI